MFPSILIVDDEPSILKSLSDLLSDEGFDVTTASNGYEALKIVDTEFPDLVLLDIWMPGIDGIETLKEIKKDNPGTQVIIITGHGTIETAVKATKFGAYDLIEKPLSIDKVIVAINNALNFRRLEEENKYLRKKNIEKHSIDGSSSPINELRKQIAVAAPTDKWILISGENGTGKELVARTIHQLSPRVDQPLIDLNCAAIPEVLIENDLFGHEKGAFEGAVSKKIGKFDLANTGTLFLDEVGDMSLKTQAQILRVLQEQKFERIGGSRVLSFDIRIIAATNKNLKEEIKKGSFREELYYRLNVIPIEVPPLRDRIEDIPLLINIFLEEFSKDSRNTQKRIDSTAIDLLMNYDWPGNVRELKNLIERLTIMVTNDVIQAADIPKPYCPDTLSKPESMGNRLFVINHLKDAKKAFEKEYVRRKLLLYEEDIAKTAKAIDVEQPYINRILNE
jgi:two-component system nitrogen regulation response regulator NtrX